MRSEEHDRATVQVSNGTMKAKAFFLPFFLSLIYLFQTPAAHSAGDCAQQEMSSNVLALVAAAAAVSLAPLLGVGSLANFSAIISALRRAATASSCLATTAGTCPIVLGFYLTVRPGVSPTTSARVALQARHKLRVCG